MALQKNVLTSYWINATYWVITKIIIDRINLSVDLQISGYANKEAEIQKLSPLTQRSFSINFIKDFSKNNWKVRNYLSEIPDQEITPELLEVFEKISKIWYELIKKSDNFSDANES